MPNAKELKRSFGRLIREKREKKNLSQDGLGHLVGKDRQQIYRIENGLSGTRRETVIDLAKALGVDSETLLYRAGFGSPGTNNGTRLFDGVRISFTGDEFTDQEKREILFAVRLIALGVRGLRDQFKGDAEVVGRPVFPDLEEVKKKKVS